METVYFVNGFLDAGKTTFIKDLLKRESFRIPGKTLILLCEEGDTEYEEKELQEANAVVELIEEENDFEEEHLAAIAKRHNPERIVVEFNGMWDRKNLHFPWFWEDIMEITIFDASTFKLYADNMRSYLAEQVRNAELVVFYKADEVRDKLASYSRNIKAINNNAAVVFRGDDGDIVLDPDECLPYDINSDELRLDDGGFAVMCIDSMERYEAYDGKTVHFIAGAYQMRDSGDNQFVAGRQFMTCCEADLTFLGIICRYRDACRLKNKEWVEITGKLCVIYDELLKRCLPACTVVELKKVDAPLQEIVTLF